MYDLSPPLPPPAGLEGDEDLQFLLVGGELVKIRSSSWKKNRFFKLQEDCKTFWHESHKTFRRNQTCECHMCLHASILCVSKMGLNLIMHKIRRGSIKTSLPPEFCKLCYSGLFILLTF